MEKENESRAHALPLLLLLLLLLLQINPDRFLGRGYRTQSREPRNTGRLLLYISE